MFNANRLGAKIGWCRVVPVCVELVHGTDLGIDEVDYICATVGPKLSVDDIQFEHYDIAVVAVGDCLAARMLSK